MNDLQSFRRLGLAEDALEALRKKGFEEPTPIQEQAIPLLLTEDVDLIGQAQTGTGKTAGFGLPIMEKLDPAHHSVQVLVLTPTRELAIQVAEELDSLKGSKRLRIAPIYGGSSMEAQLKLLRRGLDIVVGTPGRILDHLNRKTLKLQHLKFVVLDEADEMLNMGFLEDVEKILQYTPEEKRVLLFSATMPPPIRSIAKKYMKAHKVVSVRKEKMTVDLTDQLYVEVYSQDRFEALCRIIDFEADFYGLVFCRTRADVDAVANRLMERGYPADALHGEISQSQREKILNKFKKRRSQILVATDVAARGLDIQDLTHVINYALPQDAESYVHRVGRTGRAGKEGTAITLIEPREYRRLRQIKSVTKSDIRKKRLPDIKEVIENKKARIKNQLHTVISSGEYEGYEEMAEQLLEEHDAKDVLAAVLKMAFQEELEVRSYDPIATTPNAPNGKTRLFVALGRNDGMTLFKLLDFIRSEVSIHPDKIQNIQLYDKFSFVSVPSAEAENILKVFKRKKRGRKPMVVKARQDSHGRNGSRY